MRSTINLFSQPLQGEVDQVITRNRGRVKCKGSYWPARLYEADPESAVSPGQFVTVVGIEGITMLVLPEES